MLIFAAGKDMVQDYSQVDGVQKLDGYDVQIVKKLRGSKCRLCKKPHATTACYKQSCKWFYHLPCGILNGSVQFTSSKSYCPKHSYLAHRGKVGFTKITDASKRENKTFMTLSNRSGPILQITIELSKECIPQEVKILFCQYG